MLEPKSKEKITNKITEIKDCKNNNDKKALIQALNIQDVESNKRDSIQNGEIKTNTFIMIKRKEYEKTKLNKPRRRNAFYNSIKRKNIKIRITNI